MSVYLAVGESTVESTLSIIEANQFREITHLCLRMRKGNSTGEILMKSNSLEEAHDVYVAHPHEKIVVMQAQMKC